MCHQRRPKRLGRGGEGTHLQGSPFHLVRRCEVGKRKKQKENKPKRATKKERKGRTFVVSMYTMVVYLQEELNNEELTYGDGVVAMVLQTKNEN
jgi:hypothetical protein